MKYKKYNLQDVYDAEKQNKFIKLTLSNKGLRIVNKLGLDAALTKYGLDQ